MLLEKATQQIFHPISHNIHYPYSKNPTKVMATEFAMPVQQFTASPNQYNLYNSQPTSPVPTPNNSSPTSPRSNPPAFLASHTQLKPPKSPMYVPAVLRPTDPPRRVMRKSPLTPAQSQESSFNSVSSGQRSQQSTDSGKFGLGAVEENEWASEGFGKVTGLPTQDHWKPDADAAQCDAFSCHLEFGLWPWRRRHHCRRCGQIFCDNHTAYDVPLDQDASYHPGGAKVRACEHCYMEYRKWRIARSSRSNSESSELSQEGSTPTVACGGNSANALGKKSGHPNLATSVPQNAYDWSTF